LLHRKNRRRALTCMVLYGLVIFRSSYVCKVELQWALVWDDPRGNSGSWLRGCSLGLWWLLWCGWSQIVTAAAIWTVEETLCPGQFLRSHHISNGIEETYTPWSGWAQAQLIEHGVGKNPSRLQLGTCGSTCLGIYLLPKACCARHILDKMGDDIYIRDYVIVTRLGHFFERICQLMT
jgi:hypothetical protein